MSESSTYNAAVKSAYKADVRASNEISNGLGARLLWLEQRLIRIEQYLVSKDKRAAKVFEQSEFKKAVHPVAAALAAARPVPQARILPVAKVATDDNQKMRVTVPKRINFDLK